MFQNPEVFAGNLTGFYLGHLRFGIRSILPAFHQKINSPAGSTIHNGDTYKLGIARRDRLSMIGYWGNLRPIERTRVESVFPKSSAACQRFSACLPGLESGLEFRGALYLPYMCLTLYMGAFASLRNKGPVPRLWTEALSLQLLRFSCASSRRSSTIAVTFCPTLSVISQPCGPAPVVGTAVAGVVKLGATQFCE